jgi:hypothetical protein
MAELGSDNLLLVDDAPSDSGYYGRMNAGWGNVVGHAGGTMAGVLNLVGVTDGSNPPAGMVGEQLSASQATATAIATGTPSNIAQLNLTAGDWTISGIIVFTPSGAPTSLTAAVNLTSATLPTATQIVAGTAAMTQVRTNFTNAQMQTIASGVVRVSVNQPTSVYLVGQGVFGGTLTAQGYISARRMR